MPLPQSGQIVERSHAVGIVFTSVCTVSILKYSEDAVTHFAKERLLCVRSEALDGLVDLHLFDRHLDRGTFELGGEHDRRAGPSDAGDETDASQ